MEDPTPPSPPNPLLERGLGLTFLLVGLGCVWLTIWLVSKAGVHELTVLPGGLGLGAAVYGSWRLLIGSLDTPPESVSWKEKGNFYVLVASGLTCITFWSVFAWMDQFDWPWTTAFFPGLLSALAVAALLVAIPKKKKP